MSEELAIFITSLPEGNFSRTQVFQFKCEHCGKISQKQFRNLKNLNCRYCNVSINERKTKRAKRKISTFVPKHHYVTKYIDKKFSNIQQTFHYKCEKCGVNYQTSYGAFYDYKDRGTLLCKEHRKKESWFLKYGTENPFKLDIIQNKIKATMNERYGVDYAAQNKQIYAKVKDTNLKKYGNVCSLHGDEQERKTKDTMLQKYGSETIHGSQILTDKLKKTNLERYGNEYAIASDAVKEKIKSTFNKKYNADNYMQTDEFFIKSKKIIKEKYGVDHIMHNEQIYNRMHNTMLQKYGVLHSLQNADLLKKSQITFYNHFGVKRLSCLKYKYDNLYFDSSWELAFYLYCKEKNIKIIREPQSFEYYFDNEKYKYYPDFKLPCGLVEIKSDFLFSKMQIENTRDNEKYKCMIKNNITILLYQDIKDIIEWAKSTKSDIFDEALYYRGKY